jgi:hypothetical protein
LHRQKKEGNSRIKESSQRRNKTKNRLFKLLKKRKEIYFKINDDVHVILNDVEMMIDDDKNCSLYDDDDFDGIYYYYHLLDTNLMLLYDEEMHLFLVHTK